jgi:ABC-type glycerol-3-phosphate transport system permease component
MRFKEFAAPVRLAYWLVFSLFTLLAVGLAFWVAMSAFKSTTAIFRKPFALPSSLGLSNFQQAWVNGNFGEAYFNSFIITGASVIGILVFEGLAGYAFARVRFRGRSALFWIFLIGQTVPAQMVVLPSFLEVAQLHLADSQLGLILQYWSWAPFAALFFRASFLAIPREVEEAARIDGASRWRVIRSVVAPMARNAFASVAVIYALWIWNDFLFPIAYLRSPDKFTVPLALATFEGTYTTYWGQLIAALIITTVPPLLFFLAVRRQLEGGFAGGAVKM